MPDLQEVTVHGDIFGVQNWWEFSPEWQRDIRPPEPDPILVAGGGGGGSESPSPPAESFAPPMPAPLPEVLITAPKVAPPAPPILPTLVAAIARIAAPIATFLFPTPMGPRELDEAPDPLPMLPEVVVSPPRTPRAPRVDTPIDPIMPPNWYDLLDWTRPGPFTPGVPIPNFEIPPAPTFFPDPMEPELEPFSDPIAIPIPAPRYRPTPGDRSTPGSRPDPRNRPGTIADPFGSPLGDFPNDFAPDVRPGPVGNPGTYTSPFPIDLPLPFTPTSPAPGTPPQPKIPLKPYVPLNPGLNPDFTAGPINSPFQNPFAGPIPLPQPRDADKCKCKPCTKKKDKKKKKRKDREVCYRGTYQQRSKGIDYKKLEEIPCSSKSKAPKLKLPKRGKEFDSLKDLAGSIFGTSFQP